MVDADDGQHSVFADFEGVCDGKPLRVMTPRAVHENQATCMHANVQAAMAFEKSPVIDDRRVLKQRRSPGGNGTRYYELP